MSWTRAERYRLLQDVKSEELITLEDKVNACPWRQSYHIQPPTGLLNDPNGFSYYNGEYHLFYQWFPLGPVHGLKYWYHVKSKDLVHWDNVGIGITPSHYYDSHGAFSGTSLEYKGELYLMYTGNTRDGQWNRYPYQCIARMKDDGVITKRAHPVIDELPIGYTEHFRDPKLLERDGTFYALIGAQREDETGCLVLYRSKDMIHWEFEGELEMASSYENFGYMWECPDYFSLNHQDVIMFCPQGLETQGNDYQNIHQSGYIVTDKMEMEPPCLRDGTFREFDQGFDFYAPQTTIDEYGRRILIGWMGMPEMAYPTDKHGWAHCLTLPRELRIEYGKIKQIPLPELRKRRQQHQTVEATIYNENKTYSTIKGISYELYSHFNDIEATEVGISLREGEEEQTLLKYDRLSKKIVLDRSKSGVRFGEEQGTTRECSMQRASVTFHVFVDRSSIEVFINDGEEVFTARVFPSDTSNGIRFYAKGGCVKMHTDFWVYS